MVEPQPSKLMTRVRFPSPAPGLLEWIFQSACVGWVCPCGSVVEHSLGKGEVAGPIPAKGTRIWAHSKLECAHIVELG